MRILRRLLGLEGSSEPPGDNGAELEDEDVTLDETKKEGEETRRISQELRAEAEETSLDLQRIAQRIAAKVEEIE
jgi:hypothetical protein